MTTLMTVWLISGLQVQVYTSDSLCAFTVEAIASGHASIVSLPNGQPVEVRDAMCQFDAEADEENGEPA